MAGLNVVIIGSGNLAWHITALLSKSDTVNLVQIVSRHPLSDEFLPFLREPISVTDFQNITPDADMYLLAISDDALSAVSQKLAVLKLKPDAVVAHLSGSLSAEVLSEKLTHRAVWYPLQTFTKGREVAWNEIPCFVCANSEHAVAVVLKFSRLLGLPAIQINAEEKLHLHLAAVVVNNFVNHLLALSHDYLQQHDINPQHLYPLIQETFKKALEVGPENAQTGPARRMDKSIIDRHLHLLKENEKFAEIYRMLSESIYRKYRS